MPAGIVVAGNRKLTAAQWARWEQVGLGASLSLDELVLNWVNRGVTDLDARGALSGISVDRTIEGGSTISLTLTDPESLLFKGKRVRPTAAARSATRKAFRQTPVIVDEGWDPIISPDLISRAMEIELDGVVFRLVQVRASTAAQTVELTFEDRIVYWLKRKRGERRVDRGACTRAEFILSLLREVKAARGLYRFVCPDLHVRQSIDGGGSKSARRRAVHTLGDGVLATAASTATSTELNTETGDAKGGFAANASLTVKGVRATPEQKRNLHGVLTECLSRGCSTDVMVATVCCVIQESVAKRLGFGDVAGPDSRGLFQQRAPWGPLSVRMDPRGSTGMFLTGGRGGQPGWKQKNDPKLRRVPGGIEAAVTRVQVSVGGYVQHQDEARQIVRAWGGASAEGDAAGSVSYAKSYQFTRNTDENSWDAMQRLAQEVGWRCFVVGNSVYYISEADLYARRARYEVHPDDPALLDVSWDVDWGKTVSELTLDVALDRWGAPPGSVITVEGFGPPDGRWLVSQVSRDYFAPNATVTLKQPGKALLEPANEMATRGANAAGGEPSLAAGGGKAGKLYAEAKRISDAGGTYVYGGGHGPALSSLRSGQGLDCSSSTSLALWRAGMMPGSVAQVSGWFARSWGQPGRGQQFTVWANDGHVWTQFHGIGNAWRFDTSPYGSGGRGPRLRTTPRPTDGFTPRHWRGS